MRRDEAQQFVSPAIHVLDQGDPLGQCHPVSGQKPFRYFRQSQYSNPVGFTKA
jgi:hypothetical protein